jgi:hypothetical protein
MCSKCIMFSGFGKFELDVIINTHYFRNMTAKLHKHYLVDVTNLCLEFVKTTHLYTFEKITTSTQPI